MKAKGQNYERKVYCPCLFLAGNISKTNYPLVWAGTFGGCLQWDGAQLVGIVSIFCLIDTVLKLFETKSDCFLSDFYITYEKTFSWKQTEFSFLIFLHKPQSGNNWSEESFEKNRNERNLLSGILICLPQ